jgi:hypothetical protein
VVEELVHRLLHALGAVFNRRQMVSIFCDEETILILTQVNNSDLYASFDPRRVRSYFSDRLLLPTKYEATYVLQFGNAFSHGVHVTFGSVQERNTALQGVWGFRAKVPGGYGCGLSSAVSFWISARSAVVSFWISANKIDARPDRMAKWSWSGPSGHWAGGEARAGPVPKSATATTATTVRFNSMPIFDSSSPVFSDAGLVDKLPCNCLPALVSVSSQLSAVSV